MGVAKTQWKRRWKDPGEAQPAEGLMQHKVSHFPCESDPGLERSFAQLVFTEQLLCAGHRVNSSSRPCGGVNAGQQKASLMETLRVLWGHQ